VVVTVRDQGIGIPAGKEGEIFDRFIPSSETKTGAGGAGLAICREMIGAHQGLNCAENRPGGGAVFCPELSSHPSPAVPRTGEDSPASSHEEAAF